MNSLNMDVEMVYVSESMCGNSKQLLKSDKYMIFLQNIPIISAIVLSSD